MTTNAPNGPDPTDSASTGPTADPTGGPQSADQPSSTGPTADPTGGPQTADQPSSTEPTPTAGGPEPSREAGQSDRPDPGPGDEPDPPDPGQPSGRTARAGQGSRLSDPAFPEDLVRVNPWPDPVLDSLGHDPRSGYVERYWLSILGPSCLLLLRRLAAELEQQPEGFDLNTVEWASELGIGMKGGKNGPFWRAIGRACRFGAAQRNGNRLAVRRRLPPLTSRQIERLPLRLQESHHRWSEARLQRSRRPTVVKWSPYHHDGPEPDGPPLDRALDDAA